MAGQVKSWMVVVVLSTLCAYSMQQDDRIIFPGDTNEIPFEIFSSSSTSTSTSTSTVTSTESWNPGPTPFPVVPEPSPNQLDTAQCIRGCLTTQEYNPICGTNGLSYDNMNKLRCAQNCGVVVDVLHFGKC